MSRVSGNICNIFRGTETLELLYYILILHTEARTTLDVCLCCIFQPTTMSSLFPFFWYYYKVAWQLYMSEICSTKYILGCYYFFKIFSSIIHEPFYIYRSTHIAGFKFSRLLIWKHIASFWPCNIHLKKHDSFF